MSALAIWRGFPQTKSDIDICVTNMKAEMLSGDYKIEEIDLHLKKAEEIILRLRKDVEIKNEVRVAWERYAEKTIKVENCEVTKKQRKDYFYDLCNDDEILRLYERQEQIKADIKDRQEFLKTIKTELTIADAKTGEIRTLYPPSFEIVDILSVKIL